ncbi:MAG: M23 family metallopeptidase [Bacteroidales bacterium]|nr:M23 family metallopeptidase [Bacteroidales bacterium]
MIFQRLVNVQNFTVIGFLLCSSNMSAQNSNFGSPLNIPLELSASFAELRSNAFHTGLDFRTQQREGLPIYAVADGTLMRVVVSATGYGRALYLSHANGIMSVYAHLQRFIPAIEKIVRQQHYAKESFELDFQYPEKLHFKKGDLIGYSGNSGSSGGPHLHFELRTRGGEVAVNPALHGYSVRDNIPPTISTFAIYPNDDSSLVNGQQTPLLLPVKCNGTNCSMESDTIRIFGKFAFGIEATDKANAGIGILGLNTMKVFIDDELKFAWKLDAISFSHRRFINAFMDYAHYDSTAKRIQWTHLLPGNRLNIYDVVENRGVYTFVENGVQNLRIEAADISGNTSVLNVVLWVDDEMENNFFPVEKIEEGRVFSRAVSNVFETDEIQVTIPANALYDNINFTYRMDSSEDFRIYSNIHHVHHSGTPVHVNYALKIKPKNLPKNLESKALIVSWDAKRNVWIPEGGRFNNGFVLHNIGKFSTFAVRIDTVAPTIRAVDVQNNRIPTTQDVLTFRIDDDFSGIGSYRATINGKWFLMEYDAKNKTLKGTIDKDFQKGEHNFRLTVTDRKNNSTTYNAKIIR